MAEPKTICHPRKFQELSSKDGYRQNDGTYVGGRVTYWCTICGSVYTYANTNGPYSSTWEIIKVRTPLQA